MEEKLARYFNILRQFSHLLLSRVMDNGSSAKVDMKLSQLKALAAFKENRPLTMKELASSAMVKLPNMTTMVDDLIKEGLATREKDASDRRKVLVYLTPKGRALRDKFMANRRALATSIFSGLSEEKKNELLRALETVCRIFEETLVKEEVQKKSKTTFEGSSS